LRYIATVETAKHRFFVFLNRDTLPDNMLVNIASEDAFHLGVLSSRIHVVWALAAGGRLGVGNDPRYNKSRCFEPFPFPACSDEQKERIRTLAESLDAHRKRQQKQHPKLTMTGMYNVLEKLRSGEALSAREKTIHEQGLVAVLKQLHEQLDEAVADAYGWSADMPDEEILERLVALNQERAEEEARGRVRWLRPDYQNPGGTNEATQEKLPGAAKAVTPTSTEKRPWPKTLPEQIAAVRAALARQSAPIGAGELKKLFKNVREAKALEILQALASIGQARETEDGRYVI
jgi:hypothetical protein